MKDRKKERKKEERSEKSFAQFFVCRAEIAKVCAL